MLHHWLVDAVEIGSASKRLRLSAGEGDPGLEYLEAHLMVEGLSATQTVYAHEGSGWHELADFFSGLANDWRGWHGVREWASIESDLKIEARHQYGHVQIRITLRHYVSEWGNDGWTVSADLTLEPGEQLRRVAAELQEFVGAGS